jgi:molybdate transport system permease protein
VSGRAQHVALVAAGGALLLFLVLPLVSLLVTARDFGAGLSSPLVWPALKLSLLTTSVSLGLVVLLGTPLAWLLSRSRAATVLESVVNLPGLIPPAVAGVALLMAFGRRGLLGTSVTFTTAAVVIAEVFVSAPFYVQAATSAFRRIDPMMLLVARTLGAGPWKLFFRVAVPIAAHGLVAGAAMSWARSLGEFGATLMFAGNMTGVTQTMPLAIYTALESDLAAAQSLSIVLVAVAFALLVGVRLLLRRVSA